MMYPRENRFSFGFLSESGVLFRTCDNLVANRLSQSYNGTTWNLWRERNDMQRFLLGLLTALLTLAVLLGCALFLAQNEEKPIEQMETTPVQTLPRETLPVQTSLPPETLPEEDQTIDFVPRYYQTDYPYISFGNGTLATSGCSVTCLAMVATYLTDQEYTPVQMAHHFGSYGKNNIERLDYGLDQMQLPYVRTVNVMDVLEALRSGKVAIVMMDGESVFTTQQHFIVVAGMTEDGKFIVNDPLGRNYADADLPVKDGYDNGFQDFYLMRGFSGGWIFDKADMGSDPFLFDASLPQQQENRYEGYILTDDDIYTLACFVWAEAREESPEVQQAVAEVVLNRLVSGDYPDTVPAIIKRTELYRAVSAMAKVEEPELDQYIAVDAAMYGPYILPEDVCFYSAWETGEEEWGKLGSFTFFRSR